MFIGLSIDLFPDLLISRFHFSHSWLLNAHKRGCLQIILVCLLLTKLSVWFTPPAGAVHTLKSSDALLQVVLVYVPYAHAALKTPIKPWLRVLEPSAQVLTSSLRQLTTCPGEMHAFLLSLGFGTLRSKPCSWTGKY
jgi:hypothetical protein